MIKKLGVQINHVVCSVHSHWHQRKKVCDCQKLNATNHFKMCTIYYLHDYGTTL